MARTDMHFRLRLPGALKTELFTEAQKNRRSMTAEILVRLEQSLRSQQAHTRGLVSISGDTIELTDAGRDALAELEAQS